MERTILSENQYITKFISIPNTNAMITPVFPPNKPPKNINNPKRAASNTVVFIAFILFFLLFKMIPLIQVKSSLLFNYLTFSFLGADNLTCFACFFEIYYFSLENFYQFTVQFRVST